MFLFDSHKWHTATYIRHSFQYTRLQIDCDSTICVAIYSDFGIFVVVFCSSLYFVFSWYRSCCCCFAQLTKQHSPSCGATQCRNLELNLAICIHFGDIRTSHTHKCIENIYKANTTRIVACVIHIILMSVAFFFCTFDFVFVCKLSHMMSWRWFSCSHFNNWICSKHSRISLRTLRFCEMNNISVSKPMQTSVAFIYTKVLR